MTMLIVLSMLFGASAQAACTTPSNPRHIEAALDAGTQALESGTSGLEEAVAKLHQLLPCASVPISRAQVATLHRLEGAAAFAQGGDPVPPFTAARVIERHRMLPSIAPIALRLAWSVAGNQQPLSHQVPEPMAGRLVFDGIVTLQRPDGVPTLVQLLDEDNKVLLTTYLGPLDPLPRYPAKKRQAEVRW